VISEVSKYDVSFMNANKMKTPLLLVHGKLITIQVHLPYKLNAIFLKGLETPARMVILPKNMGMQPKRKHLTPYSGNKTNF
jgi:hypothetical protein